ncbi:MAG: hypothetical protein HXY44_03670 [Syntrophaceae bacterium]|nr:hypothetical protein [Syntrophaceae bacterium]
MKKTVYSLKAKKKENFSPNKLYHGLCASCELELTCTYHRDPKHPILQCEEFRGLILSPVKGGELKNNPLPNIRKPALSPKIYFQQYKGLCETCEEKLSCTYPKPLGGVWHCEEFR